MKGKTRKILEQNIKRCEFKCWELHDSLELIDDYLIDRFDKLNILDKFPTTDNQVANVLIAISILEKLPVEK